MAGRWSSPTMTAHELHALSSIGSPRLKVLMVKLTSLGDVIHTLAAARELVAAKPQVELHWAVDEQFASILHACPYVHKVHPLPLRRLGLRVWHADWRQARASLRAPAFDAIVDAQGLTKSAWVSWMARLTPSGQRYALAHRTDGSAYEAPTCWVCDVPIDTPRHVHAVERARLLCAMALSYPLPTWSSTRQAPWLVVKPHPQVVSPCVALVHGTSRADKAWPLSHWMTLGQRLAQQGFRLALMHGNAHEAAEAEQLQAQLQASGAVVDIWPRSDLSTLTRRLAACQGVIGVDGGVSHIAVALGLPHVQIYNFDTAWRTGPLQDAHQISVFDSPFPGVDPVWQAWLACEAGPC